MSTGDPGLDRFLAERRERESKKPPAPVTPDPACGTKTGYDRHRAYGEPPCQPCVRANSNHVKDWRHRTGRAKPRQTPVCGTFGAYKRHKRRKEPVDPKCREAQQQHHLDQKAKEKGEP